MAVHTLLLAALMCGQAPKVLSDLGDIKIIQEYDRFDDDTTVSMSLGPVWSNAENTLRLRVVQFFDGADRSKPLAPPSFRFMNVGTKSWRYLDHHPVVIIADGERFPFETEHKGKVIDGGVLESLSVELSPRLFQKILVADIIQVRVGIDDFTIGESLNNAIWEFGQFTEDPKRTLSSGQVQDLVEEAQLKETALLDDDAISLYRQVISGAGKSLAAEEATKAIAKLTVPALKEERARKREALENTAARKAALARSEQKLKLAKNLEKLNPRAAAQYYKEAIAIADENKHDSPELKAARERLKALGSK